MGRWSGWVCVVALTATATALTATVARAQSDDDAMEQTLGDRDAEARLHFRAGRSAFAEERWDDALSNFQRAYELSQRPELLYNVGEAADRAENIPLAIESFEAYLDQAPEGERSREVRARLRALNRLRATNPYLAAEQVSEEPEEPSQPVVEPEPERSYWWVGIVAGAVAVLAVGLAVGLARRDRLGQPVDADAHLEALRWER